MSKRIGIGRVLCSHGLDGKLKIEVEDLRQGRFYPGQILYTGDERVYEVQSYSDKGYFGFLKLAHVDRREDADRFKGQVFYIDEHDLPPLGSNAFYIKDLTGLSIQDPSGHVFGHLDRVLTNVANDIFVMVNGRGEEVLIPAVKAIILAVDLENKRIIVNPIEGLFHEN